MTLLDPTVVKALAENAERLRYAYEMGRDSALNGPNLVNCHISLFATRALADAWQRGKREQWEMKLEQGRARAREP